MYLIKQACFFDQRGRANYTNMAPRGTLMNLRQILRLGFDRKSLTFNSA